MGSQGDPDGQYRVLAVHRAAGDAVHLTLPQPHQRNAQFAPRGSSCSPAWPCSIVMGLVRAGRRAPGPTSAALHGQDGRRHRVGRPGPRVPETVTAVRDGPPPAAALNQMLTQIEVRLHRKVFVRGTSPPVRRRRLARTAHAPHLHPRLRRVAAPWRICRRGRASVRPCIRIEEEADADGWPGRGPSLVGRT